MSANLSGDLGGTAAADVALPVLAAEDAWILETAIDEPSTGLEAPLPTDASTDATKGATAGAVTTPNPAAAQPPAKLDDVKPVVDAAAVAAVAAPAAIDAKAEAAKAAEVKPADLAPAAKDAVGKPADAAPDPELSAKDNAVVNSLPDAERSEAANRFKRSYFMDHYLNPAKPAEEVRQHLEERSPSQYAKLETSILETRLSKPDVFARDLYQRAPETYSSLASEIYRGAPKYFAKMVTGRDDVTPEQVQTALAFHDKHKDDVTDEVQALTAADEAKIAEMEEYFPDEAVRLRKTLEDNARISEENKTLKAAQTKDAPVDPNKAREAEAVQQAAIAKEVSELWDLGRDAVGDFIVTKAYDPVNGVGIHVTAEERANAPLVARLKDFKASVLFQGLEVDGKPLLPDFHEGLTEWGKDREGFKDAILAMDKFTQAREKKNVLEVADSAKPFAAIYYSDRMKHPIFAEIDSLIALVTERGQTTPKFDRQVPGHLPSTGGAAPVNQPADSDAYLVADALGRATV